VKRLLLISFLLLTISVGLFPQTQLLKVGNAAQYSIETSPGELWLTVSTETINGKEYFKRKICYPWIHTNYYEFSYERIEGDSLYFILSSNNTDSLVFNFNWIPGTFKKIDTVGNVIYFERIDSIKIEPTFIPNDTVYYVGLFGIDLITGDTLHYLPPFYKIYKKFGIYNMGMWVFMEGVKIDGIRYGTVYPFPEEIAFSYDSIYVPSIVDTGSVFIINNSDYEVRIDSIISVGNFYGYRGWFTLPQADLWFYLFHTLPNYWTDTLGIMIAPHDSVKVSFYDVDLCPICDTDIEDYFIDTFRFVLTFNFYQNNEYDFSKSIQICGEGHPSSIDQAKMKPDMFILYQNYPNPFNPTTTIEFGIPEKGNVRLSVLNILGEEIRILLNEEKEAGYHSVDFNSKDLPSGVYFYRIQSGPSTSSGQVFIETKKMILIR
jgi:hypothetical protein